jgi:hypothetical protein
MVNKKISPDKKSRVLIPLLSRPHNKGELIKFYFVVKTDYKIKNYYNYFDKITKEYLDRGIIEYKEKYPKNYKKPIYLKIDWEKFIDFYINQHFKSLSILKEYYSKKNYNPLNNEEINLLTDICCKHQLLIFKDPNKYKNLFQEQSLDGYITMSLYLIYSALIKSINNNDAINEINKSIIVNRFFDKNNRANSNEDDSFELLFQSLTETQKEDYQKYIIFWKKEVAEIKKEIKTLGKRDRKNINELKHLFTRLFPFFGFNVKKEIKYPLEEMVIGFSFQ